MKNVEEAGRIIEVGKLLAGVVAVSVIFGVATAGFGGIPDRLGEVEMAQGTMMNNFRTMEDRIEAVERSQADIKKELQLITCLQLAEARKLSYQECIQ